MKNICIATIVLFLIGCSQDQVEEFAFRKTLESDLIELCGENDEKCITSVKNQIVGCMESSNWRQYLENFESEEELNRFTAEFYACIVDSDGTPYFEPN